MPRTDGGKKRCSNAFITLNNTFLTVLRRDNKNLLEYYFVNPFVASLPSKRTPHPRIKARRRQTVSHLQHPRLNSPDRLAGKTIQHTQTHAGTHSSDRQSRSKLPRRKKKRKRKPGLSETIVSTSGGKLDDCGLLLSQLLFCPDMKK